MVTPFFKMQAAMFSGFLKGFTML